MESTMEYFRVHLFSTEYPRPRYQQQYYATVYIQDNDGMQNLYYCGLSLKMQHADKHN